MQIGRVTTQDCSNFTVSGTTRTATYAATPVQNRVLVSHALLSTTVANVTIPSGWSTLVSRDHNSGTYCILCCIKVAAAGESTSVTFSKSDGAGDICIAAYEYAGAATTSPGDQSTTNNDSGSQVITLPTGTTGTTVLAQELIVTAVGLSSTGTAPSWTNATLLDNVNGRLFTGQRLVTATGTYTDTLTWSGSNFAAALIATLKSSVTPTIVAGRQAVNRASTY